MTIPIFYRPEQSADPANMVGVTSPSPSKPKLVMEAYGSLGPVDVRSFEPVTRDDLARVHTPAYVDGILDGSIRNGFSTRDTVLAETFRWTVGSFVAAARYAASHGGIVHSPTSGFHHAGTSTACGYCTFNGLALAARTLQDDNVAVAILDLDMHYGNGTAECLGLRRRDRMSWYEIEPENVRTLHHGFFPIRQVSHAWPDGTVCIETLVDHILPDLAVRFRSSNQRAVLLYQAGADSHVDDPHGGYLTTDEMRRRDELVFNWCVDNDVACAYNLAGGYQLDAAGAATPVVALHLNTMMAAMAAIRQVP